MSHESATPIVRTVLDQTKNFINRKKIPNGIYSEQAIEAVHQDFDKHWQQYKRVNSHSKYAEKLCCGLQQQAHLKK